MDHFKLVSKYKPTGDQPQAIEQLVKGFKEGNQFETLLGVTGSGKTFTMANVIQALNKPTLIISHNKTLAGQLYGEMKEFFPENAVEYFVSYYDYYQPEAYVPQSDTYIAKDSAVNDEIDKLRLSATAALTERKDVIVVASVSCIYGLGSPDEWEGMSVSLRPGWKEEFDRDSAPYTSTIVFLVRKGNPKGIKDWDDLTRPDVEVITPDPKSSGGACWNFLAALSYAKEAYGDEAKEEDFLRKLYAQVSVMDSGARGSTTTFVENQKGDVLIAWENEALTTMSSYPDEYELITPSVSILAQPSVAIVDDNADANGTQEVSREYLEYLYSDEAQRMAAEYGYRPANEEILNEYADKFDLNIKLYTIDDYGGWDNAYKTYFDDGAMFDEIYEY